jgi:three-Cys-motif partner protein
LLKDDCHARAEAIVEEFPRRGTLALAFVDPEGFEVRFDLFRAFANRPIDILFLFPSGIGVNRNLARFARSAEHTPMDSLWGSREWRNLPVVKRLVGDYKPAEAETLDQSWATEFCKRVATLGYVHFDASPPLCNDTNVPMYHLLFFSKHDAGLTIWRGISKIQPDGQRRLW